MGLHKSHPKQLAMQAFALCQPTCPFRHLAHPLLHVCPVFRCRSDTLWEEYSMAKFIPFNPTDKYTVAFVKVGRQWVN